MSDIKSNASNENNRGSMPEDKLENDHEDSNGPEKKSISRQTVVDKEEDDYEDEEDDVGLEDEYGSGEDENYDCDAPSAPKKKAKNQPLSMTDEARVDEDDEEEEKEEVFDDLMNEKHYVQEVRGLALVTDDMRRESDISGMSETDHSYDNAVPSSGFASSTPQEPYTPQLSEGTYVSQPSHSPMGYLGTGPGLSQHPVGFAATASPSGFDETFSPLALSPLTPVGPFTPWTLEAGVTGSTWSQPTLTILSLSEMKRVQTPSQKNTSRKL